MTRLCILLVFVSASFGASSSNYFYWRYPRANAAGQDLTLAAGSTIDQFAAQCNSLANCAGFNTEGFLKVSTNMTKADCDLYVRASLPQAPLSPFQVILPTPSELLNGSDTVFVPTPFAFNATNGINADLEAAFTRYNTLIFNHATTPAQHRRTAVLARGTPPLASLQVIVANYSAPLQLGVDESYALDIPSDGSPATLSAATLFGAYRGLETFSQVRCALVWVLRFSAEPECAFFVRSS